MGKDDGEFDTLVYGLVCRHVDDINEGAIHTRKSKKGNYISVTITITARSREQLDNIYQELTACEQVLMAL